MAIFYKDLPRFVVESHVQHGPTFISFRLVTDGRRWSSVGCYLSTRDASALESILAAIGQWSIGIELLISGNFNIYLDSLDRNDSDKAIAAAMAGEKRDGGYDRDILPP